MRPITSSAGYSLKTSKMLKLSNNMLRGSTKNAKLFQLNMLNNAVGGLYYPVIPLYLKGMGMSTGVISIILSSLFLSGFASTILWGRMADSQLRRRKIITVATIGSAVFYMILALPLPLILFIIMLLAVNLMASGVMPIIMAEVSGWAEAVEGFGYFWMGASLGYAVATSFAGYVLDKFGIWLIFLLSSALMLGVYALARNIIMSSAHSGAGNEGTGAATVAEATNAEISGLFWVFTVAVIIFLVTDVAKNLYIPVFYAFNLKMGDALATLTLGIEAFLEIPVIYVFTKLINVGEIDASRIFGISLILAGVFFIVNALIPPNPIFAFLAMASYALVWGTYSTSSSVLVSRLVGLSRRGTAYGVYNSTFPIANIIGPIYIGYVISLQGYRRGLMYLSIPPLAMGVITPFIIKPHSRKQAQPLMRNL